MSHRTPGSSTSISDLMNRTSLNSESSPQVNAILPSTNANATRNLIGRNASPDLDPNDAIFHTPSNSHTDLTAENTVAQTGHSNNASFDIRDAPNPGNRISISAAKNSSISDNRKGDIDNIPSNGIKLSIQPQMDSIINIRGHQPPFPPINSEIPTITISLSIYWKQNPQ